MNANQVTNIQTNLKRELTRSKAGEGPPPFGTLQGRKHERKQETGARTTAGTEARARARETARAGSKSREQEPPPSETFKGMPARAATRRNIA